MIAAIRAELVKMLRRRVLVITAITTIVFAVGSAAVVLASADPAGGRPSGRGVTVESLSGAGGGTEVFTTGVSFAGTFLFVLFVGVVAVEFSRGTFRTMLMHQPRRLRLLAGKTTALLAFAATVLAVTAVLTAPSCSGSAATRCSERCSPCWCGRCRLRWRSESRGRARSSTCCRTPGAPPAGTSRAFSSKPSSRAARRR
jgi:ABC-2 type transport system permease protein